MPYSSAYRAEREWCLHYISVHRKELHDGDLTTVKMLCGILLLAIPTIQWNHRVVR